MLQYKNMKKTMRTCIFLCHYQGVCDIIYNIGVFAFCEKKAMEFCLGSLQVQRRRKLDICYNKLFKMLIDKGMKKTEFRKQVGISEGTLAKLSRNENVSMDVIVKICRKMNCKVDDILDIVPSPDCGTDKNIES